MPLYEYRCDQDGTVIELMRPMAEADRPVEDPEGKGRLFRRQLSTFMSKGEPAGGVAPAPGGCCPCGKNRGGCGTG